MVESKRHPQPREKDERRCSETTSSIIAADVLLFLGFAGAIASVGSGLWLVAAGDHGHARELDLHHWFAYAATGVAALAVPLRTLQRRRPHLATVKTVALAVSAALGPIRWPARPSTRQPP